MAERMKDSFGPEVVVWVAEQLARVDPGLDRDAFTAECLTGFEDLELMDRGRRIADVMGDHLPADPHVAIPMVTDSLGLDDRSVMGDRPATDEAATGGMAGMAPFRYLPMVLFVASHGLGAFEESMAAQHALTKRFTAEFSIRPFLVAHPEATLERLRQWTGDPDPHVRRLVSEGTRPRLPWAPRLRAFVDDPAPVVELLELLMDDESEYVRRSVANNLNDIGKDHPELAVAIARRWWSDGDERRRALVRHGLRGLVKRGDPGALEVLGHARTDHVEVREVAIEPAEARIGQRVRIVVTVADVRGSGPDERTALDVVVHFVKASGRTAPRVFKGGVRDLAAGGTATYGCTVSVAQHSTRTHHPGVHRVEAQINGRRVPIGEFTLVE
jgi:3-methyladenine DNA glycosylase AlkC